MNARMEPRNLEPVEAVDRPPNPISDEVTVEKLSLVSLVQCAQSLEKAGELAAAADLYARWIAMAPDTHKHLALFNYGGLLQNLGRLDDAQEAYESCIALKPDFAQPYLNLGLLHEKQRRTTNALKTWLQLVEQAHTPKPPSKEFLTTTLNHIGRVQEDLKNYQQAERALERSLLLDPAQTDVLQHWVHIRQKSCSWPIYKSLPGISYSQMRQATSPLAMLALTEEPAEQLANSVAFVKRKFPLTEKFLCEGRKYNHRRLRIGYVSADFREHAVGFLLPPFLSSHSKQDYELFGYDYTREEETDQRQMIKACFEHFRSIHSLTDEQAAELILADEIDILVDLHGLSAGTRPGIFALHPAPLQGTYLGFIGPTGMPWIDFVITDKYAFPEKLNPHFTERPIYLNQSFIPSTTGPSGPSLITRKNYNIKEDMYLMGAFGNTYKIIPELFSVWMNLLTRIKDAVLWLIDDNILTTSNLKNEAKKFGVRDDQMLFTPRVPHSKFCQQLRLLDVYLDTYPYNCGSTTNDVVNAKIPIVTRYGETLVSRMGYSILKYHKKENYAVTTYEEYEKKVIEIYINKKLSIRETRYEDAMSFNNIKLYQQIDRTSK